MVAGVSGCTYHHERRVQVPRATATPFRYQTAPPGESAARARPALVLRSE